LRKKVKITDVKVMIVRGPTWDWNLFKIETDAGVYGIGEGYWGPGAKDITLKRFKEQLIGEDPLNVVKLYTKLLFLNGGYGATGGLTMHAASGDRKCTRLNSSHSQISYAVFCLKKK